MEHDRHPPHPDNERRDCDPFEPPEHTHDPAHAELVQAQAERRKAELLNDLTLNLLGAVIAMTQAYTDALTKAAAREAKATETITRQAGTIADLTAKLNAGDPDTDAAAATEAAAGVDLDKAIADNAVPPAPEPQPDPNPQPEPDPNA